MQTQLYRDGKVLRQLPVAENTAVKERVHKVMAWRNIRHKPAPNHSWRDVAVVKPDHDEKRKAVKTDISIWY